VRFGHLIGNILELATESTEVETAPVNSYEHIQTMKNDPRMAAAIAQGFFESTEVGTFDFTKLLECVYEADQSAMVMYQAVEMLEKAFKRKDPNEAFMGVMLVVAFLQGLKQTIPMCEAVDSSTMNWEFFDHIVKIAEDPEKQMRMIGEDIVFNEATITTDLAEAFDAFRSEDFTTFGYDLGDAMNIATGADTLTLY